MLTAMVLCKKTHKQMKSLRKGYVLLGGIGKMHLNRRCVMKKPCKDKGANETRLFGGYSFLFSFFLKKKCKLIISLKYICQEVSRGCVQSAA